MFEMKAVITLVLLLVASASTKNDPEWEDWKMEHNKEYSDGLEELKRHTIWQANKRRIDEHNANANELGFTLGLNQFSDLETDEVRKMMMNIYTMEPGKNTTMFMPDPNFRAAENVNWTAKGAVTPVGYQGQCGSCWAFSATGALEGQHFIKTGKLVSLSEQNLMDCTKKYGTYGCSGGFMKASFEYVKDNGGIDTEGSYPYEAKDGNCRFKKTDIGATCTGYVSVPSKDEQALMQAVQTVGPVSVAIDGQNFGFINYKSGIYYDPKCSQTNVNHTPLVVGFGTLDGKDYWLAKNSWGTKWGMNGYIMMARNRDNNCGIATQASYPTV